MLFRSLAVGEAAGALPSEEQHRDREAREQYEARIIEIQGRRGLGLGQEMGGRNHDHADGDDRQTGIVQPAIPDFHDQPF